MNRSPELGFASILAALAGPGVAIAEAENLVPDEPGLYAIYGSAEVWDELELGRIPDARPLYVGKAESSLRDRDLRQHFANGRTGSSTVRRSFAALLHDRLGLRGMPRNPLKPAYFANYGLSATDDAKLTDWMSRNLSIATWSFAGSDPLADLEASVMEKWKPPLNLAGVVTPWSRMVGTGRALMAAEARAWTRRG